MQEFDDTDAFKAAYATKSAEGTKFLCWFTGKIDEESGQSWCGDCVEAKGDIMRVVGLAQNMNREILKGNVTREEWRGNQDHPFRQAPFGAGGVPCMLLLEGNNVLHKVEDLGQFHDQDLMDLFLDE